MFFETGRDQAVFFARKDNTCSAHFHRSAELMYVLCGEKRAILNGKGYALSAGGILVCPPYAVHAFSPSPGSEQIVVAVPAEYCARFEAFCETRQPESPVFYDRDGRMLRWFEEIRNADNEVLLEGIVNCILGNYLKVSRFFPLRCPPERSQISRIAEYIDRNYAAPLSLSSLAAEFGYSPNYFSALFKKYFRTGIAQYINSVRVQKSLPLLKTHKIEAISLRCGFRSPQQYFLNFRRFFGCTPREYLRAGRK